MHNEIQAFRHLKKNNHIKWVLGKLFCFDFHVLCSMLTKCLNQFLDIYKSLGFFLTTYVTSPNFLEQLHI